MMKRILLSLFLILLFSSAAFAADDVEKSLKNEYMHHVLGLKSFFQKGDQEFDSTGKPLKDPEGGEWNARGGIWIEDIRLDQDKLRISGPQVASESLVPDKKKKKARASKPEVITIGRPMQVVIHLDHPVATFDEAKEVLDRVFFLDTQDENNWLPEYQRAGRSGPMDPSIGTLKEEKEKYKNARPPEPKYTPDPGYSMEARQKRFEGTVYLQVIVDKSGEVTWIQIKRALGMGLDEEAVDAVKQWKFNPAKRNGEPVPIRMTVEVDFHLG
jgi:TonB family protein